MPRKGWKAITVSDEVYDYFQSEWEKQKKELRKHGVNSFSGFVTKMICEALEKEKKKSSEE
jgi:predicted CopG family antitoxin